MKTIEKLSKKVWKGLRKPFKKSRGYNSLSDPEREEKSLYIGLYPVNGESLRDFSRHHFSLLIGPKDQAGPSTPAGKRIHIKHHLGEWIYESLPLPSIRASQHLRVYALIATILDEDELIALLEDLPTNKKPDDSRDEIWSSRVWVKEAVSVVRESGYVEEGMMEWERIEMGLEDFAWRMRGVKGKGVDGQVLPRPMLDLVHLEKGEPRELYI